MPDTATALSRVGLGLIQVGLLVALLLLSACQPSRDADPPMNISLYQSWELQPGDRIANHEVLGGLGDISIALNGSPVYAPFDGTAHRDPRNCVLFASPNVPAYLFRFCGLNSPRFGALNQGETIGSGSMLQFAALRKQPNGTWAIVEPSKHLLERTLQP